MDNDRCYECEGYGDDYYYDADTDEFISACVDCPYNIANNFEDEWKGAEDDDFYCGDGERRTDE